MNPAAIIFWLMEHWYYVAVAGAVILAAAMWGGVLSIAAVVKAILAIVARVAKFFATPADQIAEKALYGFIVATVAASIFYQLGKHDERGGWLKREAEHAAAMKRLETDATAEADAKVKAATRAERDNTQAAEKRADEYAEKLKQVPIGSCGLDDSDLAAGGLRAQPADRINKRRHSK